MIKRVMSLVMLLLPVTAAAQETTTGAIPEGIVAAAPTSGPGVLLVPETTAQARTPAAGSDSGRRRPSMVGYVNDSTIASQVRLRFDAGRHIGSPDRAEFFYAKCGCYRGLPTTLDIYDPDAAGPAPGILNDANFQQLFLYGEYGLMQNRASVFVELPVRWLKPQRFVDNAPGFGDQAGISDVRFGAKVGLMSNENAQATALVQVTAPSGDSRKGLGTNHASIEPALLVAQRVADRVGIEAQFGGVFPTGGSPGLPTSNSDRFSGSVLYYGVGPSFDVYSSSRVRFSPVVELVGWRILNGFRTVCSGVPCFQEADKPSGNIANIKIGARVVVGGLSSIYAGYGHHVTDQRFYEDIFRVEFRRSF